MYAKIGKKSEEFFYAVCVMKEEPKFREVPFKFKLMAEKTSKGWMREDGKEILPGRGYWLISQSDKSAALIVSKEDAKYMRIWVCDLNFKPIAKLCEIDSPKPATYD